MSRRTRLTASALALIAAVMLTGCSFSSPNLAVLETEREAEDELPPLEADSYDPVDTATSRYVGEHDGVSLWVAKGTDSPACLIAIADPDEEWGIACGGLPTRLSSFGHTFELTPDGSPAPEGMTRISENVYAE